MFKIAQCSIVCVQIKESGLFTINPLSNIVPVFLRSCYFGKSGTEDLTNDSLSGTDYTHQKINNVQCEILETDFNSSVVLN